MKIELAILPLEVWADIFLSPYQWINRQELAQFYNNIKDRGFARKLNKLLHDCGKPTLHYLKISNPSKRLRNRKIPEFRASFAVAYGYQNYTSFRIGPEYKNCDFPVTEMPENIKTFKRLTIKYLDDEVLDFLDKIKSLFTNVRLAIESTESAPNMRIFFTHFIPMVGSIRGITCDNTCVDILTRHFPGTLALTKELDLFDITPAFIPALLKWLAAPQDFGENGPKFLKIFAESKTIFAIADAVQKQFLTATTPSTFVIFLQFCGYNEQHSRVDEFKMENGSTNEELTARNAHFEHGIIIHYVEILRSPAGANAKVREWIKERAYYEKKFNNRDEAAAERVIWIDQPTIGPITKKAKVMKQDESESMDEDDEAGPSTSAAKKMKK